MKNNRSDFGDSRWLSLVAGLSACCLLSVSVGCNQGPAKPDHIPDLTACSVTVTYNGQPVQGASVLLAPTSGQLSAAGVTDSSGKAVLKVDGMWEGVAPGEYRVTVTKMEKVEGTLGPTPENPAEYEEYQKKLDAQPAPKHLIPEKYSGFTTSGLTITIADGTPVKETFELTD